MIGRKKKPVISQATLDLYTQRAKENKDRADSLMRFLDDLLAIDPSLIRFRKKWVNRWGGKFQIWAFDEVREFAAANIAAERYAELNIRFGPTQTGKKNP